MSRENNIFVVERKAARSKVWQILRIDVDPRDYPANKPWKGDRGYSYRLVKYCGGHWKTQWINTFQKQHLNC